MNSQDAAKKGNGVNTEKVTARRLTAEEVSELSLQDEIFVSAEMDGLPLDCYAPASLTEPGKNFEEGPSLRGRYSVRKSAFSRTMPKSTGSGLLTRQGKKSRFSRMLASS